MINSQCLSLLLMPPLITCSPSGYWQEAGNSQHSLCSAVCHLVRGGQGDSSVPNAELAYSCGSDWELSCKGHWCLGSCRQLGHGGKFPRLSIKRQCTGSKSCWFLKVGGGSLLSWHCYCSGYEMVELRFKGDRLCLSWKSVTGGIQAVQTPSPMPVLSVL
jgi:hypothetical protein